VDNSKHLAYAEAQGTLLRWILFCRRANFIDFVYGFLFFANAFIKAVLLKRNYVRILLLRFKGFLDFNRNRRFID